MLTVTVNVLLITVPGNRKVGRLVLISQEFTSPAMHLLRLLALVLVLAWGAATNI